MCLVRHDESYCPYFVSFTNIKYYRRNYGSSTDDIFNTKYNSHLSHNHPNPFNPTTTISYSLANNIQHPQIEIYNIKGQKVKTFNVTLSGVEGSPNQQIIWNGKDENNKSVSSGIYFYKLRSGKFTAVKKMILMK